MSPAHSRAGAQIRQAWSKVTLKAEIERGSHIRELKVGYRREGGSEAGAKSTDQPGGGLILHYENSVDGRPAKGKGKRIDDGFLTTEIFKESVKQGLEGTVKRTTDIAEDKSRGGK